MRHNLYKDLYELEEKHWWHIAKRESGSGKNVEVFEKIGSCWGIDFLKLL